MTDYRVDTNFDIILPLQKITNISEMLFQQVRLLLHTWQEDFVYDIRAGMPYEQEILGKKDVDGTDLEVIYYRKISKLPFFKTMENFKIATTQNREIIISFDVISIENRKQNFIQEI